MNPLSSDSLRERKFVCRCPPLFGFSILLRATPLKIGKEKGS